MFKKFKLITNSGKSDPSDERRILDAAVETATGKTTVELTGSGAAENRRQVFKTYADFERKYVVEQGADGKTFKPSDSVAVVWEDDPRYTKA